MDIVAAVEDPDKLVLAEDLVILVMRDSWQMPKKGRLPFGFCLDSARHILTTDQKALTTNRMLLGKNNVATAVFAGCGGFEVAKSFRNAAKQVLDGAETLVIVHNRDIVWDLVDWFPTVKTLLLLHNLRLQFDDNVRVLPPARRSDLEELLGNTPAMGSNDLYINRNAIVGLLAKCPKLRRLQSSLHGDLMSGRQHPAYNAILSHEALRSCREVRLGCYLERVDNAAFVLDGVSAKGLQKVHKVFPEVTYLEVVLKSADVMPVIAKFTHLTALIVAFAYEDVQLLDFTPDMSSVLEKMHRLEELSLNYFERVSISEIARKCPLLRKLSLMHCTLVCEGPETFSGGRYPFPPRALEFLKLNVHCSSIKYLIALLTSCSKQAKQLWMDHPVACRAFIQSAIKTKFSVLERLTLSTDGPATLFMNEAEFPVLLEALPALKHVTTDSYDLRLLFWNFTSPPGRVGLAWCQCTICAAEFPRVDKSQKEFWDSLQAYQKCG